MPCLKGNCNDCIDENCLCKEGHAKQDLINEATEVMKEHLPNYDELKQNIKEHHEDYQVSNRVSKSKDVIDYTTLEIKRLYDFITLRESNETLLYDGKIYNKSYADSIIKEETEKIIENCGSHDRTEVINKIKAQTFKDIAEFDKDPNIISVDSGILYLDSLKLKKHTPDYLSRVLLPVEYQTPDYEIRDESIFEDIEKNLKDTLFWKYLKSSFTVDEEFRKEDFESVLEITASFFVKHHIDERSFLFLGRGENGKSVLMEYIENMLGEEKNVTKIPLQELTEDRFMRAELAGMSANIYPDLEVNELRKTGKFKAITSNENITAQKKHQQPFLLKTFVKLLFSCNRFPKVFDQSQGFFRRWMIIKWERDFENDPERDALLRDKLKANTEEKSKVFSCLVHLARKLRQAGKFSHSKDWREIQKEWNANADPLDDFVNNYILDSDEDKPIRETYQFYKEIMLSKNERPLSMAQFGKAFSEYYEQDRTRINDKQMRVWLNIDFKIPTQTKMMEYDNL